MEQATETMNTADTSEHGPLGSSEVPCCVGAVDKAEKERKDFLHRQLIKLGDMMGDGLHHEPDGKWIPKEYRKILKSLGIGPKKKNHAEAINKAMLERIKTVKCTQCSGHLCQVRSGSMVGQCVDCGAKYKLLKRGKGK